MNLFSAWLVHLYTASGALAAFFGTLAVFAGDYRQALLWMVAATVVDATDGLLARKVRVKERLPAFDGAESLPAMQTTDNTCDLRGLRVDDAWPMLETFLDRALNDGQRVAFVVHGHGSGALREKVREELKRSQYVSRFRSGQQNEGGEGVTVVWLA